jgi:hypothetical protein
MHVTCSQERTGFASVSILVEGQKAAYAVGENGGTFVRKAADALGNFVCGLYRDYPGAVIDTRYPVIRDFGIGIMDGLCAKRPPGLPLPYQAPFAGGQCMTTYNLTLRRVTPSTTGGSPSVSNTSATIPGKIYGLQRISNDAVTGQANWVIVYENSAGQIIQQAAALGVNPDSSVSITSIVRADGQADNCGDRPPGFPPAVIPPERISRDITIPLVGGAAVAIPVVYTPIRPTLNVPVQPKFGFDLGGIPVTLDAGGFTFNLPDAPENRLPGGSDTGSGGAGGGTSSPDIGDALDDLGDKIDGLRDSPVPCIQQPKPPTPGDPEIPPDETMPTEGKEEDRPGLKFLEVVVTKLPDKEHFGKGGQNVIFAGWIAFRAKSGGYYPREQINFRQSVFPAPEGADGYTVTFTNGAEGRVREYVEESVSEED